MDYDKRICLDRDSDRAMARQSEYDAKTKIVSAICAVCGKTKTQKKQWLHSRYAVFRELRMQLNFCRTCNRWVCGDCHLVDDGNGNGIGICTECAKENGISGLTIAQFDEAWPEIVCRRDERREAAQTVGSEQEHDENCIE